MRPQDDAQRNRRIVRPTPQHGAVFRRLRSPDEPPGLLGLVLLSMRRPMALGEIGAGGITDGRVLVQLAGVYAALAFARSLLAALLEHGLAVHSLGPGIVGALGQGGSLLMSAFGLWIVAQFTSTSPGFVALLSGLALVHVITTVLVVAFGFAGAPVLLLAYLGPFPAAVAAGLAIVLGIAYFVLSCLYGVWFLMGVFDMNCLPAIFLGVLAGSVSAACSVCLIGLVGKLVGA